MVEICITTGIDDSFGYLAKIEIDIWRRLTMNNVKILLLSTLTVGIMSGLGYTAVKRIRKKQEEVIEEESE